MYSPTCSVTWLSMPKNCNFLYISGWVCGFRNVQKYQLDLKHNSPLFFKLHTVSQGRSDEIYWFDENQYITSHSSEALKTQQR